MEMRVQLLIRMVQPMTVLGYFYSFERSGTIVNYKANGIGILTKKEGDSQIVIKGRFENDVLIEEIKDEPVEQVSEKESEGEEIIYFTKEDNVKEKREESVQSTTNESAVENEKETKESEVSKDSEQ